MTGQVSLGQAVRSALTMWLVLMSVAAATKAVWWWPDRNTVGVAQLGSDLIPWAIGAAVLSLLAQLVWWRLRVRRQARVAVTDRIAHEVLAVTGRPTSGRLVHVIRWRGRTTPARLKVRYPGTWDAAHEGARRELSRAVADVTGQGWTARYSRLGQSAIFRARPQRESASDCRAVAQERLERVVRSAIPGARTVSVKGWNEAGDPTKITATYTPSPRIASPRIQDAVTAVVTATMPGRWTAEWDTVGDRVTFSARPGLPAVSLRPMGLERRPSGLRLRYAVTEDGAVHFWDLEGSAPHGLFVGATGGGKTTCLRAIALDAIGQGLRVDGCDPKRIELNGLIGVPGVGEIATSPEDIAALIHTKHALMEKRYQEIERDPTAIERLTPHLFIVDEFYILVMRLNRLWKMDGGKGEHPAIGLFWELVVLARSARIHIAVGVQRPDAEFLDGFARDSIRHRVSLGPLSESGARMMWGTTGLGMDLPGIRGRAVASDSEGRGHEIQVWHLPNPDPRMKDRLTTEQYAQLVEILGPEWEQIKTVDDLASPPAPLEDEGDIPSEVSASSLSPADAEREAGERVRVDTLVAGDLVRLDGKTVTILSADFSEGDVDDEEYVDLEWQGDGKAQGVVSMPAEEILERLVATDLAVATR